MKEKAMKENLKIDLFNLEREKISAQAMGNLLGGGPGICACQGALGEEDDTNTYLR